MRIGDMKKTIRYAWRVVMAMAVMAVVAGCADGELATPVSPNITPPAPMIIKFAADPSSIRSGESTTISWEVAGADEVEITAVSSTGEAVAFDVKTEDLSGEAPVTLTSTTDFVLTATKTADSLESEEESDEATLSKSGQIQFGPEPVEEEPLPSTAPAVSSVSQTITVTVIDAQDLTADIEADKPSVEACEQTVVRWTVNPSDNVSVVVTADTGEAISPTDQCSGSIADILGQPVSDPVPAVGCAVVAPCETTNYTVNATDSHGNSATDSAVVSVDTDVNAKIMAAKDADSAPEDNLLVVESFSKPVLVSWEVTPEAAKVTVTATPSASCTPALPVDASDQATGQAECQLTGETKFHIVAAVGSESDEDEVVVSAAGGAAGLLVAKQWAFVTEKVDVEMKLTAASNPMAVAKVTVNGDQIDQSLLNSLQSGSVIKVENAVAKLEGIEVKMFDSSNAELDSENAVTVVQLLNNIADEDEVSITSIKYDRNGIPYVGVQRDGFHEGKGRMYIDGSAKYFDFGKPIMESHNMENMWNLDFFEYLETYPVNVAYREGKPEHVFAGTTGALMMSIDGEATTQDSWRNIMVTRRLAGPGYDKPEVAGAKFGDHLTCGRAEYEDGTSGPKLQKGSKARFTGDIISLNQVCDVFVSEDGWAIVATDFGVQVEKNLDNNQDNDEFVWIGTPYEGATQEEIDAAGVLTYGKIVNDIEVITDDSGKIQKVFAAVADPYDTTSGYVYVSEDGGIHWKEFGTVEVPAYALAYDARNHKLYAGTELCLAVAELDSENWNCTNLNEPVISIAIDPSSPAGKMTIMAGTPKGVQISRDGGNDWSSISIKGGEAAVESLAIYPEQAGGGVNYHIMIGSTAGHFEEKAFVEASSLASPITATLMPIED